MIEFSNLVYLDVQKTGSTYINKFLSEFCSGDLIGRRRHAPVASRIEGKLHIISCRDPLSQYLSLYAYGCGGGGGLRETLGMKGLGDLYSGDVSSFVRWLDLVLTPSQARAEIARIGDNPLFDLVGLQTFRFLTLALPSGGAPFGDAKTKGEIELEFMENKIFDVLLRAESLNDDLKLLVTAHPSYFAHLDRANKFLAVAPRKNVSRALPGIDLSKLPIDILTLVQEREWFFFEQLSYKRYTAG